MGVKVTDVIYDSRLRGITKPDFSKRRANILIEKSSTHSEKLGCKLLSDESRGTMIHIEIV